MARDDWFRRSTWTDNDQVEFFERLDRSRTLFHKSQYVRIQAYHLQEAGLLQDALELLGRLYDEWPYDSELSSAYWQEATCHLRLGDQDKAIAAYRNSIAAEERGGTSAGARLDFLWLVATRRLRELYAEALESFGNSRTPPLWPVTEYRTAGALALIYSDTGNPDRAQRQAAIALDAAAKTTSGLRYHSRLGLVINPDRKVIRKLKKLAGR